MNPFRAETSQIVDILQFAREQIEAIPNTDIAMLKTKIVMDLRRHENNLRLNIGETVEEQKAVQQTSKPLTSMFGTAIRDIRRPVKDPKERVYLTKATDVEKAEMAVKVDEAYKKFHTSESDHLLDSLDEMTLRGVGMKAGLPATETEPKLINLAFIEQIKEAIKNSHEDPDPGAGSDAGNGTDTNSPNEYANAGKSADDQTDEHGPLTNESLKKVTSIASDQELADQETLKNINELYEIFPDMQNKDILETYPDIEIRGVARKAGLLVTETEPRKISIQYITSIKSAIKRQRDIEQLGENKG